MKITFVIPYFYPAWEYGGQPRSAYDLARALVRRGHAVRVLTTDSGGQRRLSFPDSSAGGFQRIDGVEVFYYRNISNFLAYKARAFWSAAMKRTLADQLRGSDVLHIHELRCTTSVLAYLAARRQSLPYVVSPHGGLRHLGKRYMKTVFDALWGRRILRDAAFLLAISPVEEQDARLMNIEGSKIRRLPNAVSPDDYVQCEVPGQFRRQWGLEGKAIVLFLGRLHWVKGADLLIRAFASLAHSHSNCQLVVAGPDDGEGQRLKKLVDKLGIGQRVTFTGFLDQAAKMEALSASRVLAVPSRSEVFALTVLEALLCRTPVLMSSACGLHPRPGEECGVQTFENENISDLTTRLAVMLDSDRFAALCGESGPAFVQTHFSTEEIGRVAEGIYHDALYD